jgi:uncharacterized protein (TIGR00255 family)
MIYSMTGFGKDSFFLNDVQYVVELKSLNSKQADVFMRIPPIMKELEISLRKLIINQLKRGKFELNISSVKANDSNGFTINKELLARYQEELSVLNIPSNDLLGALMRLPNVVVQEESKLEDEDIAQIKEAVVKACNDLDGFRMDEGVSLYNDLELRVNNILFHKEGVIVLAPQRIERLRARMLENLKALNSELEINEERLEQELIFYIEKLDVSEEFVRLKAHCAYFKEVMDDDEMLIGKKLNFISQEMGREINTLGSKANDADIQKHVVQMKDELEKIKEQVNNVL